MQTPPPCGASTGGPPQPDDCKTRVGGGRQTEDESYFFTRRDKPAVEVAYRIKLIHGNANPELAASVARCLNMELCKANVKTFANGEISIKIAENVRGDDCFVLQPTTGNDNIDVNTALMELLLIIHTLRLSSVKRITAIIPYFAYSRQDRKTRARVPISASAVAQLIQSMGVDRVVTVDLHCGQIQGFFRNMPLDNLTMFQELCHYITRRPWFNPSKMAIVSPDAGGVERATLVADRLGASHIVTILKRRGGEGQVESMQTVGNVSGHICLIVDDMIDTGGTLVKACQLLKTMGANHIVAWGTHGILTGAIDRVNACDALDELIVSDSIPQEKNCSRCPKLTVLSLAPLVAQVIHCLHNEKSVSTLFVKGAPTSE